MYTLKMYKRLQQLFIRLDIFICNEKVMKFMILLGIEEYNIDYIVVLISIYKTAQA